MQAIGFNRGVIRDYPVRHCANCREYKGLVECEDCGTTYCVFCEGNDTKFCPDCEDVRFEDV